MKAKYQSYTLNFKRPSGTSRGVMTIKETWFLYLEDNGKIGIGECGLLKGLSVDDRKGYKEKMDWVCSHMYLGKEALLTELREWPSIQFGLEMAYTSLRSDNPFVLFPSAFTEGTGHIAINGLVWMGDVDFMRMQIKDKIEEGFNCIKLKIGALDFETELNIIKGLRKEYSITDIEIRVDANGAFNPKEALHKLKRLSEFDIHSIEQPIQVKQLDDMARLCEVSPVPIALDEELIGVFTSAEKEVLLQTVNPQYIILKPSLVGGFSGSSAWIEIAEKFGVKWWVTSALESNIGLNAIAQWTYTLGNLMPQGLGTGGLFTNNFDSPMTIKNGTLRYDMKQKWNFNLFK
jgi:o-succinylbenzoate synthase